MLPIILYIKAGFCIQWQKIVISVGLRNALMIGAIRLPIGLKQNISVKRCVKVENLYFLNTKDYKCLLKRHFFQRRVYGAVVGRVRIVGIEFG